MTKQNNLRTYKTFILISRDIIFSRYSKLWFMPIVWNQGKANIFKSKVDSTIGLQIEF